MRIMTEKPLNAETPTEYLRSWITDNDVFFKRNQGQFMEKPVKLSDWTLSIEGLVEKNLRLTFEDIRRRPKVELANTLECSGNSRSLLKQKASGNPWTIGGVGNALWGGIWLKDLLEEAGLNENARQEARRRLGIPSDQLVIVTFGMVSPVMGALECLWALEQLHAWGVSAHLYFVGEAGGAKPLLSEWIEKLGLSRSVHLMQEWVSDQAYRDFLLAADFAIQLRKHFFGGLSGALLDCIGAGLPTVANQDLAEAMEAPDFVLRVPDQLSATLIAESLADGIAAGLDRRRLTEARSSYLAEHSFDRYARLMMKVLALD